MKNLNLIAAALAVGAMLGISNASAADMAMKTAPYVRPVPVFSWTGCYIGVHGGGGVLRDQGFEVVGGLHDKHGIGGLAGGQIGCNYQTGMLVLGIEGEGFWSGMKATSDVFAASTLLSTASNRNKWDYDVAGRFGVAFDRALVYGKAGWVAGRFDWNAAEISPVICAIGCVTTAASDTLHGLLIGIGLEYAFAGNWTAKFEYDYLGFGTKNVNFTTIVPGVGTVTTIQNLSADKHIFKVGVNYLFNMGGPVEARY